jgi:hypothetical protein
MTLQPALRYWNSGPVSGYRSWKKRKKGRLSTDNLPMQAPKAIFCRYSLYFFLQYPLGEKALQKWRSPTPARFSCINPSACSTLYARRPGSPNITNAWFAEYGISERLEDQGGPEQLLVQFRQAVFLLSQDFDGPTGRLKMKKDSPPGGEDRRAIQAIRIG